MVQVFREVWRVLRDDGTLFLNIGDSYASGKGTCYNPGGGSSSLGKERKEAGVHPLDRGNKSTLEVSGLKPKDLVGIPWRVAFALQADGWYLRSDIIWSKPNPMPESVTDRCTKSHEYLFMLSKRPSYYFDQEAVREKQTWDVSLGKEGVGKFSGRDGLGWEYGQRGHEPNPNGRNIRTVWTANKPKWKLRSDLSDGDRAYVLAELNRRGLLASSPDNTGDLP